MGLLHYSAFLLRLVTVFQLFLLSLCSSVSGPSLPLLSIYIPLLCVSTVYSHCSAVSLPSCIFPLPPTPMSACMPSPSVRPSFLHSFYLYLLCLNLGFLFLTCLICLGFG